MIREIVKAITGEDIVLLRPENKADQEELRRLEEAGEFAGGTSMADNRDDITEDDLVDSGVLAPD